MRSENDLLEFLERGFEFFLIALGLARENVNGGGADTSRFESVGEGIIVHDEATAGVDENCAGLDLLKFAAADEVAIFGAAIDVESDEIGGFEKLGEGAAFAGVAEDEFHVDVIEINFHAEGFGENGELRADFAVADDAELFAANFVAALGGFIPLAAVKLLAFCDDAAGEEKNFAEDHFDDAARAAVGRVENGDAAFGAGVEVELVGADAECADGRKIGGVREERRGDFRFGADAEDGDAGKFRAQSGFIEALWEGFDFVSGAAETSCGVGVNVFKEQGFRLLFFHRRVCGSKIKVYMEKRRNAREEIVRESGPPMAFSAQVKAHATAELLHAHHR